MAWSGLGPDSHPHGRSLEAVHEDLPLPKPHLEGGQETLRRLSQAGGSRGLQMPAPERTLSVGVLSCAQGLRMPTAR